MFRSKIYISQIATDYSGTSLKGHLWNKDTWLIRTLDWVPTLYYSSPWNKDTSLIKTSILVPRVSILERFHCTAIWVKFVKVHVLMVGSNCLMADITLKSSMWNSHTIIPWNAKCFCCNIEWGATEFALLSWLETSEDADFAVEPQASFGTTQDIWK